MAKFKITPTTTVAELKEQFRNEVGCVLRVYQGRSEAPDGATLVSLGAKEGELECRTSRTVGKFEEAFQNELNLKVKVYTKDNWVKVLDGITLAVAGQLPNGMTKAKMEEHLSYKRDEAEAAEVVNEEKDGDEHLLSFYKKLIEDNEIAVMLHEVGNVDNFSDSDIADLVFCPIWTKENDDRISIYKGALISIDNVQELKREISVLEQNLLDCVKKYGGGEIKLYYFNRDVVVGDDIYTDKTSDIFMPKDKWDIYQTDEGEDGEFWPMNDVAIEQMIAMGLNWEDGPFYMGWSVDLYRCNNEGKYQRFDSVSF